MSKVCPRCAGTGREIFKGQLLGGTCHACYGDGKYHDLYFVYDADGEVRVVMGKELAMSAWVPGGKVVDYWTGEVVKGA
jgi:hypothetical protein